MSSADSNGAAAPPFIAALLARTPFAPLLDAGAPLFVAACENPPRALFASRAGLALLGARNLDALAATAIAGPAPGARRLRALAGASGPDAPARLEMLRFYRGRSPLALAMLCARVTDPSGRALLVAVSPSRAGAPAAPPARAASGGRFLWSLDKDLRFQAPAAELAATLGGCAPKAGETLAALGERTGLDADGRWSKALAAKATFLSLRVIWPRGLAPSAPTLLSGAPIFDRERRFLGFRGFGLFLRENAGKDEAARDEAGAAPASAQAERPEPIEAPAPAEAAPSDAAPREPIDAVAPPERGAEIVALRPLSNGANVVPIRPDLRLPPPPAEKNGHGGEASVELSASERSAFREIARALGARVKDAGGDAPEARGEPPQEDVVPPAAAPATHPPAIAEGDAARLLDRLPIGALVARGQDALYLNGTLLELLGHADLGAFRAAGGLARLIDGEAAKSFAPLGASMAMTLTAADGEPIAVDSLAETIEWRGAPATLVSFRRSAVAEIAPQLRALEADARTRADEAGELATILDTASDGVVTLDHQGRILSLNRSGAALFGFERQEIAGEPFVSLFAPDSREAAAASFEALRASGLARLGDGGREAQGRDKRGRTIPLFVTLGRVGGAPDAKFCAVLRDMTHWKTVERDLDDARREAERASALKSDFLAKISHEIRTPLNAIIGFAEVIMEERFGPVGNERYKDYLKDIRASGAHVMSLLNDLLDLSKIEAGKLDLAFAPIDANLIIQECVSIMQPQAAHERIIVRMSLAQSLPRVVADERSLRQIMLNLMSNAVKFNEPGGQVIVSTAMNDTGQAVIRVRDTGIGMSESEIATALEPFRQVANARQAGGTGLGLPLTKALTEANHALFSIQSGKQRGTLVELAFPTIPAAAAQ